MNKFPNSNDIIFLNDNIAVFVGVGRTSTIDTALNWISDAPSEIKHFFVVKDCFDRSSPRDSLKDVLNFEMKLGFKMLKSTVGKESLIRRLVDVYSRKETGKLSLQYTGIELFQFISKFIGNYVNLEKGSNIVEIIEGESLSNGVAAEKIELKDNSLEIENRYRAWDEQIKPNQHTTNRVFMISPTGFYFNIETATDNAFMKDLSNLSSMEIQKRVLQEFSKYHYQLTEAGVIVHLLINDTPETPDSVFPNNWFSTHISAAPTKEAGRSMVLYPMKADARRRERAPYLIKYLQNDCYPSFSDMSPSELSENGGKYLEGTGAMVLDRINKISYVVESQRADIDLANQWAKLLGYEIVPFHAFDKSGQPIYHTNVVMSVGTKFAVFCDEAVKDPQERENVISKLKSTGHDVVLISLDQMYGFCGNILELSTFDNKSIVAMSKTSYDSFNQDQLAVFEKHNIRVLPIDIKHIEAIGGGSVRCTLAELF